MPPFHLLLALGMLLTGTINTLSNKAADQMTSTDRHGNTTSFNHPFLQALAMFVGEFFCMIAFYGLVLRARYTGQKMERAKPFNPLIFVIPAICDMTATSIMYIGLSLTDASIFQMLRGSVIIFTSVLSVLFLKRKLRLHHWIGIVLVISGTAIVGTQSYVCTADAGAVCPAPASAGPSMATIGNILIIFAQLIVAIQMVVEEKLLGGYDVPALQVVGFEGMFGFVILSIVLVGMYYAETPSFLVPPCMTVNGVYNTTLPEYSAHFEDSIDGLTMMGNNPLITVAIVGNMFSIALFNYFGVSVTKHINASTRMVLDSMRTMLIWAFSLGVHWEKFCWIQILGFIVLIAGTVIYNSLVRIPGSVYEEAAPAKEVDAAALLDEDSSSAGLLAAVDGTINGPSAGQQAGGNLDVGINFTAMTATPAMRRQVEIKKR